MARSSAGIVILAAVAAGIALMSRNANANGDVPMGVVVGDSPAPLDDLSDESTWYDPDMPDLIAASDMDQRRAAALYMLRCCEHRADVVADGTDYQTFYGNTLFWDMSDHPVNTGEMQGVPLPSQVCINAGYANGVCVSTAAGAYQFNGPTWDEIRDYGGARLPDFTPESQDEAALRLLAKIGALPLIDAGNITAALPKLGTRWASIPGARGKQGQRTVEFALAKFNEGLQA